jgi:hypothetical protein
MARVDYLCRGCVVDVSCRLETTSGVINTSYEQGRNPIADIWHIGEDSLSLCEKEMNKEYNGKFYTDNILDYQSLCP